MNGICIVARRNNVGCDGFGEWAPCTRPRAMRMCNEEGNVFLKEKKQ